MVNSSHPVRGGPIRISTENMTTMRENRRHKRSSSTSSDGSWTPMSPASDASEFSYLGVDIVSATTPPVSPRLPMKTLSKSKHVPPLPIMLGTATFGDSRAPQAKVSDPSTASSIVKKLLSHSHVNIDTARAYPVGRGGTSESLLGQLDNSIKSKLSISTKVTSWMPGTHRAANIARSIDASLAALGVSQVDIMYLHAPDTATSLEDTCHAMHEAYQAGKFLRFGLSNYTRAQVELILLICDRYGYIRPTVYQGMYNPLCRDAEDAEDEVTASMMEGDIDQDSLLALLHAENISFHAYSPSAGGFFLHTTTPKSSASRGSRWDTSTPLGKKYYNDYFHGPLFDAAQRVRDVAAKYGISGHTAALRWTVWHSRLDGRRGDAVVVGASSVEQLEQNLSGIEDGPLPEEVVRVLNRVWKESKVNGIGPKCQF